MAFVSLANALVLLLCTITVSATTHYPPAQAPAPTPPKGHHHHHHHHAPTPAPMSHPPTPPPSKPPTPPPTKPPSKPPTSPPTKPPTKPPTSPPTKPPTKPPTSPPTKPPTHPPVKPPSYPPPVRKMVAVQGVVFCKSCKYRGVETLTGAAPLFKAVVKLQCNNTKLGFTETTKTDKNGYFFFMPKMLTTSGSHKCRVSLVSSPNHNCTVATNLHGGAVGAILMPPKPTAVVNPKLMIFTVGPFAFEAHKKLPCY